MRIAVIENGLVANVVVGEPDVVSGLFPDTATETESTGIAWIGARWNGEKFEPRQTYDSWTWNESAFEYEPPTPKPEGDYYWNESELAWLPIPVEVEPEADLPTLEAEPEA